MTDEKDISFAVYRLQLLLRGIDDGLERAELGGAKATGSLIDRHIESKAMLPIVKQLREAVADVKPAFDAVLQQLEREAADRD